MGLLGDLLGSYKEIQSVVDDTKNDITNSVSQIAHDVAQIKEGGESLTRQLTDSATGASTQNDTDRSKDTNTSE